MAIRGILQNLHQSGKKFILIKVFARLMFIVLYQEIDLSYSGTKNITCEILCHIFRQPRNARSHGVQDLWTSDWM